VTHVPPVGEPGTEVGPAPGRRVGIRSPALTWLVGLAGFYTLYFARVFLLPLTIAVLLDLLLSPLVRGLSARGCPIRSARPW